MVPKLPCWVHYYENGWRLGVWIRMVEKGRKENMAEIVIPLVGGEKRKILVSPEMVDADKKLRVEVTPEDFIKGV